MERASSLARTSPQRRTRTDPFTVGSCPESVKQASGPASDRRQGPHNRHDRQLPDLQSDALCAQGGAGADRSWTRATPLDCAPARGGSRLGRAVRGTSAGERDAAAPAADRCSLVGPSGRRSFARRVAARLAAACSGSAEFGAPHRFAACGRRLFAFRRRGRLFAPWRRRRRRGVFQFRRRRFGVAQLGAHAAVRWVGDLARASVPVARRAKSASEPG